MAHFRPGLLEGMLQGWRAAHIPPVALKAMLTDTNAAWTAPRALRRDCQRARRHAQRRPRAQGVKFHDLQQKTD